MLNGAHQAAHAPTVIALFRDFINEVRATGGTLPTSQSQQPAVTSTVTEAPRQPAMNLESLAAPGRARPATGESQTPADKPTYTRAQISRFYWGISSPLSRTRRR
jgi:hypothetical protein